MPVAFTVRVMKPIGKELIESTCAAYLACITISDLMFVHFLSSDFAHDGS